MGEDYLVARRRDPHANVLQKLSNREYLIVALTREVA